MAAGAPVSIESRPWSTRGYVDFMASPRERTIAWLLRHFPIPARFASRMLGWAQHTPPVPATAAEIIEEEAAEAERSATG
jgi:hypothetical protein